ncbi:EF-hand calcium-binding domain-containing protein 1 [Elysia marginata]|uniref:EF-hand calcium-binding domain-containing protein 1 n=1 Tax=Elysia marginata TaxID=1093978 RepID=A0AAV4GND0_9GAST|nr:EF-hand calcium-binding domain-containing protein 1 [Elysia marginata]
MSTFKEIRKRANALAQEISLFTGVKKSLVLNVIHYAKQLPRPGNPDCIDELIFMAQMNVRFGITSKFHIQLIYDAVKDKKLKYLRVADYVKMVCIFYSDDLTLKVDFVFSIYDYGGDGNIQTHEMNMLLRTTIVSVGDEEPEEQLKELIDIVINLMDTNQDGKISVDEFRDYVRNDILYIQLLGQVLPLEHVIERYAFN